MGVTRNRRFTSRQYVLLLVMALAVLLPIFLAGQFVWAKHVQLEKSLEDIRPRYARQLALEQQKDELQQTLTQAQKLQSSVLYPAQGEASQLGNSIQNSLRAALVKAGLSIASSQVKVEANSGEDHREKIQIHMTADGTISQLQLGLLALESVKPRVWMDELQINYRGSLLNAMPQVDPVLSVRMVLSVPRSREGV